MRNELPSVESRLDGWGREVASLDVPMPMALRRAVDAQSRASRLRLVRRVGLSIAAVITVAGVLLLATRTPSTLTPQDRVVVAPSGNAPMVAPAAFRDPIALPEVTTGMQPSRLRAGELRSPQQAEAWFSQG